MSDLSDIAVRILKRTAEIGRYVKNNRNPETNAALRELSEAGLVDCVFGAGQNKAIVTDNGRKLLNSLRYREVSQF